MNLISQICGDRPPINLINRPIANKVSTQFIGLSWNVTGLRSKLIDPDWCSFIDEFEVCLFQATWALQTVYCTGFLNYSIEVETREKVRSYGRLTIWV